MSIFLLTLGGYGALKLYSKFVETRLMEEKLAEWKEFSELYSYFYMCQKNPDLRFRKMERNLDILWQFVTDTNPALPSTIYDPEVMFRTAEENLTYLNGLRRHVLPGGTTDDVVSVAPQNVGWTSPVTWITVFGSTGFMMYSGVQVGKLHAELSEEVKSLKNLNKELRDYKEKLEKNIWQIEGKIDLLMQCLPKKALPPNIPTPGLPNEPGPFKTPGPEDIHVDQVNRLGTIARGRGGEGGLGPRTGTCRSRCRPNWNWVGDTYYRMKRFEIFPNFPLPWSHPLPRPPSVNHEMMPMERPMRI